MATYNQSQVLPYSIGSVIDQTYRDWEMLVIGDGCSDDSGRVVSAIGDPRVRWIDLQPGTGHQYGPNNEGLKQARGDIVAYLGHDDLWLPRHLMFALEAIDAGADFTHSIAVAVDPTGARHEALIQGRTGWIPPSAVAHRRSIIDQVGPWRDFRMLSVHPEEDLWERMRKAGCRMTLIPRLSVVKFPASLRPNLYLDRPSHEQATWLARIRAEPDFEATELARLVISLHGEAARARRVRRAWKLLREPSQWLGFFWHRGGARIKARQRYKGSATIRARQARGG
jgi:glycosyltransferase involved in cell wall biosynthesis